MQKNNDLPAQDTAAPPRIPVWKPLVLIAVLLGAAVSIVAGNVAIGAVLFIIAIFMQSYGGFTQAHRLQGETGGRVALFAFGWVLCVVLAAASQFFIPAFTDLLASLGPGLPVLTRIAQTIYPAALLAPLLVGMVWMFWPQRARRLKTASIFCWLCNAMIVLMMASMYFPLWVIA
jgi:hypothetical protein